MRKVVLRFEAYCRPNYYFWAAGRRSNCRQDNSRAARKNGSNTIPGFVSGTACGLGGTVLTDAVLVVEVVCATPEMLSEDVIATISNAATAAKALRRLFRKLEEDIIWLFIGRII